MSMMILMTRGMFSRKHHKRPSDKWEGCVYAPVKQPSDEWEVCLFLGHDAIIVLMKHHKRPSDDWVKGMSIFRSRCYHRANEAPQATFRRVRVQWLLRESGWIVCVHTITHRQAPQYDQRYSAPCFCPVVSLPVILVSVREDWRAKI